MKKVFTGLLAVCLAAPSIIATAATLQRHPAEPAMFHRVEFEYHSAFLMNVHHFLYDAAFLHHNKLDALTCQLAPTAAQMQTLREATAFYKTSFDGLDQMVDPTMHAIKQALSVDDQRRSAAGLKLAPALVTVLNAVSPIYAGCRWEADDRSNKDWIRQAKALDTVFGAAVQRKLETRFVHALPRGVIRVDAVVDTGDFRGAYTDEQIVMPSGRADYQGLAALEMLYHEVTHIHVTDTVINAIDAQRSALHRTDDSNLWHAVQFYTVGQTTAEVLQRQAGLDYRQYAEAAGVFRRAWPDVLPVMDSVWLPYMQGKLGLQEAIAHVLARLPNR